MKKLALALLFVLSACGPQKPRISDDLRNRLNAVLEDGSTLDAMAARRASYSDFGQQLQKARYDYNLAAAAWPADFVPQAMEDFNKALIGWELANYLSNAAASGYAEPTEPLFNRYAAIVDYAGQQNLRVKVYPQDDPNVRYRGMKYLTYDNVGSLFSMASGQFKDGQALLLPELK